MLIANAINLARRIDRRLLIILAIVQERTTRVGNTASARKYLEGKAQILIRSTRGWVKANPVFIKE